MPSIEECCKLLDIQMDTTQADAKRAYIDLLKIWHPDKHPQNSRLWVKANEKCKEINSAWVLLESYLINRDENESNAKINSNYSGENNQNYNSSTSAEDAEWRRAEEYLKAENRRREEEKREYEEILRKSREYDEKRNKTILSNIINIIKMAELKLITTVLFCAMMVYQVNNILYILSNILGMFSYVIYFGIISYLVYYIDNIACLLISLMTKKNAMQ